MSTSQSPGNEVMALIDAATEAGTGAPPKGPTGLLRALRAASNSTAARPDLPTLDASAVAPGVTLFDYDAALAADLDVDLPGV